MAFSFFLSSWWQRRAVALDSSQRYGSCGERTELRVVRAQTVPLLFPPGLVNPARGADCLLPWQEGDRVGRAGWHNS